MRSTAFARSSRRKAICAKTFRGTSSGSSKSGPIADSVIAGTCRFAGNARTPTLVPAKVRAKARSRRRKRQRRLKNSSSVLSSQFSAVPENGVTENWELRTENCKHGKTSSSSSRRRRGAREKRQEEAVQKEGAQARPARTGARTSLFQQHHRDHLGHDRQCAGVEKFGLAGFSWVPQRDSVCGTAGRGERRQHGARSRGAHGGCAGERSGVGEGIGGTRAGLGGNRSAVH